MHDLLDFFGEGKVFIGHTLGGMRHQFNDDEGIGNTEIGVMERRFRHYPEAIRATQAIAERCRFSLRDLSYQYPDEIVMSGRTPQRALEMLSWRALNERFDGEFADVGLVVQGGLYNSLIRALQQLDDPARGDAWVDALERVVVEAPEDKAGNDSVRVKE